MVPSFTGEDTGPDIRDFLKILEQVGCMGGWQDGQLIGIARCKMIGKAHDFAWWDDKVAAATTFSEFKTLALKRFDTEPLIFKMERFLNARQREDEEVRSFASRLRMLGTATLVGTSGEDTWKAELRHEILSEEMLSRFLAGLRDPVRRFVLSRDPKTFDEAIDVAVKEELNERVSQSRTLPVRYVEENSDVYEIRSHLDRLEKLLNESLRVRNKVKEDGQEFPTRTPYPGRCYNCGGFGHVWRECHRYRQRTGNPTGGSRMRKGRHSEEAMPKIESVNLEVTPPGDGEAHMSIAVVNIREKTSPVKTNRSSPGADEVNVISMFEEAVSSLSECVFAKKAGVPVPPSETNVVEADGSDTDGLAALPTLKVPRDDKTVPVGVTDLKLKEVRFCDDEVVGVLVDTSVVHQTMARVDEVEECHDFEGVVFVEPKENCSTLDEYRAELRQRQKRPHKIASPTPRSTAELSKWVFGFFGEDPKLRAGEEIYMRVHVERSGIG
ncbi:hypothetical protein MTO96_043124 [Rhipicephalus appendiculatus]